MRKGENVCLRLVIFDLWAYKTRVREQQTSVQDNMLGNYANNKTIVTISVKGCFFQN